MKIIRVPANTRFLSFDSDIGRLVAIAEFPDESMLNERMVHDLRIGPQLIEAAKSGMLRVRDGATRMPLPIGSAWLSLQNSVVSVMDFREFTATLGYEVVLESESETAVSALPLSPVRGETLPKLNDQKSAQIVSMYREGKCRTVAELARQFEVSRPTIDKVLHRAGLKVKSVKR